MKTFLLKVLRICGYLTAGLLVLLAGLYIYLAFQTGRPAEKRAVFERGKKRPLVFAHRGGGGLIPENTIGAFKFSAEMGVDVLELDVHSTLDGQLVVFHDTRVDRTTNGSGKISELTLDALKKLDAGYNFSTDGGLTFPFRGKGITVPTLQEVFDALPAQTFSIEPKQVEPSVVKPLCELLRARKMTDNAIVGSFRQTAIDEFRVECPEVATAATPREALTFAAMYETGLGLSYSPPMQVLQIPEKLGKLQVVTPGFIDTAHRLNLQVHVWTINETDDMKRLIDLNVDGIMTDYPDRLLELTSRAR